MVCFIISDYCFFRPARRKESFVSAEKHRDVLATFWCCYSFFKAVQVIRVMWREVAIVCWFVVCLTSQQQASVSQGRVCSDKFTCCHTEVEVADQTFYLTQSQCNDAGPTSPSAHGSVDEDKDSVWSWCG